MSHRMSCGLAWFHVVFVLGAADPDGASTSSATPNYDVVIRARRAHGRRAIDPTQNVATIDEASIERARTRGEHAAEVVDGISGVHVLDVGTAPGSGAITIRGGSPGQAAILIDGVTLRSPFATGLDLGFLDLEAVDSMEIVRGGAGSVLGDGAMTGALVVSTRRATAKPTFAASTTVGSLSTVRTSAMASAKPISIAASFERSDGDFDYDLAAPGLPSASFVRRNNDTHRGTLSVRSDFGTSDSMFGIVGGASLREAGVPGTASRENIHAREDRQHAHVRAEWQTRLSREWAASRFAVGASAGVMNIGYDDASPVDPVHSATRFTSLDADAAIALPFADAQLGRAGVAAGREFSASTEHGSPNRTRVAVFISDELRLGTWNVFGALRLEAVGTQSTTTLPRIGVHFEPTPTITLNGSIGRSLRSPAIDELHHPKEAGFEGNPALRSETAWEAEISAKATLLGAHVGADVYARSMVDTILYLRRNAFVVRPENVGDANALGGEIDVDWRVDIGLGELSIRSAFAWLVSELAATKNPLPTQPAWNLGGGVGFARMPFDIFADLRWIGPTTANLQATQDVPPYLRLDAGASVAFLESMTLALRVQNLLDARELATVYKFPLPGRTAFLTLRFSVDRERDGSP